MIDRPIPDEALYEVQVWNVDTSSAEWSILTTGKGMAACVDQAEQMLTTYPDDEQLRLVVANRA